MTRQIAATLALLFSLSLGAFLPAAAQPPSLARASYEEVVEVDIVNVDIFVVDKKGRPVTGLTADDFQLLVDGQPMQLTNILAVTDGTPQPEATGLPSEPITATPSPDDPLPPATSSQPSANPLHTVIYFDNVNTRRQVASEFSNRSGNISTSAIDLETR